VSTVPQILPDDHNRTRKSDPLSSHVAGDVSQASIKDVRAAVLHLLTVVDYADGQALNLLYREFQERKGWRQCAYESPRRRAGELAKDGLLVSLNPDNPRGTPHLYSLPTTEASAAA
jgi:hypothetical protein